MSAYASASLTFEINTQPAVDSLVQLQTALSKVKADFATLSTAAGLGHAVDEYKREISQLKLQLGDLQDELKKNLSDPVAFKAVQSNLDKMVADFGEAGTEAGTKYKLAVKRSLADGNALMTGLSGTDPLGLVKAGVEAAAKLDAILAESGVKSAARIKAEQAQQLEIYKMASAERQAIAKQEDAAWAQYAGMKAERSKIEQARDVEIYKMASAERQAIAKQEDAAWAQYAGMKAERSKIEQARDVEIYKMASAERQAIAKQEAQMWAQWEQERVSATRQAVAQIEALNLKASKSNLQSHISANTGVDMPASAMTAHYRELAGKPGSGVNEAATIGAEEGGGDALKTLERNLNNLGPASETAKKAISSVEKETRVLHDTVRGAAAGFGYLWMTWGNIGAMAAGFTGIRAMQAGLGDLADAEVQLTHAANQGAMAQADLEAALMSMYGKQDKVFFTYAEAAKGLKDLVYSGMSAAESLNVLPTVMKFATAGELDMNEASQTLQQTLHSFKLPASDAAKAADLLAKGAAASATTVHEMSQAMKTGSVVGSAYGVSLRDFVVSTSMLAKIGIEGQAAGTAVKNFYREATSPTTKQAAEAIKTLNLEFFKMGENGVRRLKPLTEIMVELRNKFKDLSQVDQEKYLQAINMLFNERGVKFTAEIVAASEEATRELEVAVDSSSGFLDQLVAKIGKTTSGIYKDLGVQGLNAITQALKESEPTIKSLGESLRGLIMSEEFKNGIRSIVQGLTELARFVMEHGSELAKLAEFYVKFKVVGIVITELTALWGKLGDGAKVASAALGSAGLLGNVTNVANAVGTAEGAGLIGRVTALGNTAIKWVGRGGYAYVAFEAFKYLLDETLLKKGPDNANSTWDSFLLKITIGAKMAAIALVELEETTERALQKATWGDVAEKHGKSADNAASRLKKMNDELRDMAAAHNLNKSLEDYKRMLNPKPTTTTKSTVDVLTEQIKKLDSQINAARSNLLLLQQAAKGTPGANKADILSKEIEELTWQKKALEDQLKAQKNQADQIKGKSSQAPGSSNNFASLDLGGGTVTDFQRYAGTVVAAKEQMRDALQEYLAAEDDFLDSNEEVSRSQTILAQLQGEVTKGTVKAAEAKKIEAMVNKELSQTEAQLHEAKVSKSVEKLRGEDAVAQARHEAKMAEDRARAEQKLLDLRVKSGEITQDVANIISEYTAQRERDNAIAVEEVEISRLWLRMLDASAAGREVLVEKLWNEIRSRGRNVDVLKQENEQLAESNRLKASAKTATYSAKTDLDLVMANAAIVKQMEDARRKSAGLNDDPRKMQVDEAMSKARAEYLPLLVKAQDELNRETENYVVLLNKAAEAEADEASKFETMAQAQATALAPAAARVAATVEASEEAAKVVATQAGNLYDSAQTWQSGLMRGLDNYSKKGVSAADTIAQATEKSFKSMEDALVEFVKTGKMNFGSFVDSVLEGLLRIQIQESITKPLSTAIGSFDLMSLWPFAEGGVPGGHSVSAYRNRVVTSPTLFAFASGAGVMGEAGPEAIMPLTRTSNGDLGVKTTKSGGESNVVVNIIESPGNGGKTAQRSEGETRILDVWVEKLKASIAGDISRGAGPIPAALERTYGANRAAGAYY